MHVTFGTSQSIQLLFWDEAVVLIAQDIGFWMVQV